MPIAKFFTLHNAREFVVQHVQGHTLSILEGRMMAVECYLVIPTSEVESFLASIAYP
jgi:hypothetical protein